VADKLSRHYADGRLDQTEFKARLDRAMGATTRGDLDGLFDDLPRLVTGQPPSPPSRRRRLVPFVVILVLIAVAAASTASLAHPPWLLLVVLALFLWSRTSRRHHRSRSHSGQ
jgi:Flp pilus assembly protein TadB